MLRFSAGIAVLAMLLTACGGGGARERALALADATSGRTPAPTGTADGSRDPRQLFITMETGLLSGLGYLDTQVTRLSSPVVSYTSSFDPSRGLVQGDLQLADPLLPGRTGSQRLLFENRKAYVLYRPECWLAGSAVPDRALADALPSGSPLDVLEAIQAQTYDEATSRLAGRVPVARVVALFAAPARLARFGRGRLSGTVPVSLPVGADGTIVELDVDGHDLATTLRPELHLDRAGVRFLDQLTIRIRFDQGASPNVPLDPPTSQQLADSTHTGCMSDGAV